MQSIVVPRFVLIEPAPTWNIVLTSVGFGTLLATFLTLFWTETRARRTARYEFLGAQLQEFYGPLFFIWTGLRKTLERVREIQTKYQDNPQWKAIEKAYSESHVQGDIDRIERTRDAYERTTQEIRDTIAVWNDYASRVWLPQLKQALDVARHACHMADPEDLSLFDDLVWDHYVFEIETKDAGSKPSRLPHSILLDVKRQRYLREEVWEKLAAAYARKRDEWVAARTWRRKRG